MFLAYIYVIIVLLLTLLLLFFSMKKHLTHFALLSVIVFAIFYSCKKDNTDSQNISQNEKILAVKQEYAKHDFSKSLSNRFNDSLTIDWEADWEQISDKKGSDSSVYYFIPLIPSLSTKSGQIKKYKINVIGFQQFIIAKEEINKGVRFFKGKYILQPGSPLSTLNNKRSNGIDYSRFTGTLFLDDFSGRTQGINYHGGQAVKVKAPLQHARIVCDQECTWTMWCDRGPWVTVTYGYGGGSCPAPESGPEVAYDCLTSGGGSSGWQLGNSYSVNCTSIDDPIDPPIPPDPGGGGDGGGTGTSVLDIANKLTTPCFKAVFSEVQSKTLQNTISKMLNKLFTSTDVINLDIVEGQLKQGTDGDTRDAGSSGGYRTVGITLNTNELQNASKEYIAATILHEVVHGIFLIKNKNPLIDDHNEMGSFYITYMADALRELYPTISSDDAKALAWGGVHESYGWSEIVRANPVGANSILETNKKYKTGTSGTKCN